LSPTEKNDASVKQSSGSSVESSEQPGDRDAQRLMAKVAKGDVVAYRTLYDRFKKPIMSYAFHIVRNQAVAEEVTQETFLRVYRARESYTSEAKFSTWLWTIARNVALDHLRKKKELPLDENHAETLAGPLTESGALDTAEQQLIDRATRAELESALAGLPDAQREALTLRTFSELSYEAIAEMMKVPVSTVKNLIHRAKNSLMKKLKGKEEGHGG
jgi:RNA polymerase sigma-70 factor, ECF subfamily